MINIENIKAKFHLKKLLKKEFIRCESELQKDISELEYKSKRVHAKFSNNFEYVELKQFSDSIAFEYTQCLKGHQDMYVKLYPSDIDGVIQYLNTIRAILK